MFRKKKCHDEVFNMPDPNFMLCKVFQFQTQWNLSSRVGNIVADFVFWKNIFSMSAGRRHEKLLLDLIPFCRYFSFWNRKPSSADSYHRCSNIRGKVLKISKTFIYTTTTRLITLHLTLQWVKSMEMANCLCKVSIDDVSNVFFHCKLPLIRSITM